MVFTLRSSWIGQLVNFHLCFQPIAIQAVIEMSYVYFLERTLQLETNDTVLKLKFLNLRDLLAHLSF